MADSRSSSARAAREQLGARLRRLREDAGLSPAEFARRAKWADTSLVSIYEKGRRTITSKHVRLWCSLCGASEQETGDLLADQANVAKVWTTYQQLNQRGLAPAQKSVRDLFERVELMRVYQTRLVPGLLQSEEYAACVIRAVRAEQGAGTDDIAEAVAERMDRRAALHRPDARWMFLLEEDVLWHRTVPVETHVEQLRHLLDMTRHPSVWIGVIPRAQERLSTRGLGVWPEEPFTISDESHVNVELVSGLLSVTSPDEIALYVNAWNRLSRLATPGNPTRELIQAALDSLGHRGS
ncbi:helix-turn-helix transcriptional regulator [Actinocorallia lasiicapitis]